MKINCKKTKAILFNSSRNNDFLPKLTIENNQELEVVEELKLLGVIITSDLKWNAQCESICQKAFSRLWMLKRLKPLGATTDDLLEIYRTQIRSVLEFSAPAWNPGLTKVQISQLERAQKSAFAIILEEEYLNYKNALKVLDMKTLGERRHDLSYKFAMKAKNNDKYTNWFCESDIKSIDTRSIKPELKPVQARLRKFEKSPLFYLTKLLNDKK